MKPNNSQSKPAKCVTYQALSDQIGVSVLEDIIEGLGLIKRAEYTGDELEEITSVASLQKERELSVPAAITAYLEQLENQAASEEVTNQSKGGKKVASDKSSTTTSKRKRTTKLSRNSKSTAQAGSQGDLQQKLVKSKKVALQTHVQAGSQEGDKLADAYRHGRQSQFLARIVKDTIADAAVVGTQLQQLNDAVYGTLELPQDFVDALEIPEIEDYLSPADGDNEGFIPGLGFTGDLARLAQGELSEEEIATFLEGDESNLEEEVQNDNLLPTETKPSTEVIQLHPANHNQVTSQEGIA
ncbi:MAG: hypothetical protein F6K16_24720 [Symploca sp. SIO2B6]|nr:hypothetical protein [Symploca sp. SIO2B6]